MPPTCNHARHSEPGGINCRRRRLRVRISRYCLFKEIFDEIFESCVVPGRKTALKDGTEGEPFLQEQPKIAFCAANVPGKNHCRPINLPLPHKSPDQRKYMRSRMTSVCSENLNVIRDGYDSYAVENEERSRAETGYYASASVNGVSG